MKRKPLKYRAIKDLDKDGWEVKAGKIKKGDIVEYRKFEGIPALFLGKKPICDYDSTMFKEYFELITEEE